MKMRVLIITLIAMVAGSSNAHAGRRVYLKSHNEVMIVQVNEGNPGFIGFFHRNQPNYRVYAYILRRGENVGSILQMFGAAAEVTCYASNYGPGKKDWSGERCDQGTLQFKFDFQPRSENTASSVGEAD